MNVENASKPYASRPNWTATRYRLCCWLISIQWSVDAKENAVPLFNEASRIYAPDDIEFLRHCVSLASAKIAEPQLQESLLAERILRLYESGLRDPATICDLAIRLTSPGAEANDALAANCNGAPATDRLAE
jgi:hypothetical protein